MVKTVVLTGASSGFGAMTVRALADAGHTVFAGMRDIGGRNAAAAGAAREGRYGLAGCQLRRGAGALRRRHHHHRARSVHHRTNHFANAGHAADGDTAAAYGAEYAGLVESVGQRLAALTPEDADPNDVARAIVDVVDTPKGQRPFRVHIYPADDGAEIVNAVGDRVRTEFYRRLGFEDLLQPRLEA